MDFPAKYEENVFCALQTVIKSQDSKRDSMLAYILQDPSNLYSIERRDKNGLTPMLLAAKQGYDKGVKLLIKYRASLRAEDNNGFTALHWAVARCHEDVVRRLLHKKADIHHVAADKLNPLQRAFSDGSPQHTNLPMVKLLLEKCADANNFWDLSKSRTFLHQAVMKNNRVLLMCS